MKQYAYRIVDWERIYEKSQGKRCATMTWVALPVKFGGMGYRNVMALGRHAGNTFTAFVLMLEAATKGSPRGVLANESGSFSPETLEKLTGFPAKYFAAAFETLSSPEIKWIEKVELSSIKRPETPSVPGEPSESTPRQPGEPSETNNNNNNNSNRDLTHHVDPTTPEGGARASDEPKPTPPPAGEAALTLPEGYPPLPSSPVGQLERQWHKAQRVRAPKHSLLTASDCAFLDQAISVLGLEWCKADLADVLAGDVSSFNLVRKRWARKLAGSADGAPETSTDGRQASPPTGEPPELVFQQNDLDELAPVPAHMRKAAARG